MNRIDNYYKVHGRSPLGRGDRDQRVRGELWQRIWTFASHDSADRDAAWSAAREYQQRHGGALCVYAHEDGQLVGLLRRPAPAEVMP